MKNLKITLSTLVLASVSFGSFAAEQVNSQPIDQQKIGVVSSGGASNLGSLEASLAEKADRQGASTFKIISAGGNNQLYGNAIIYK